MSGSSGFSGSGNTFLFINIVIDIVLIVLFIIRGLGINIKRFDFSSDLSKMDISDKDKEEYEVSLNINYDETKKKRKRFFRNFKYFYFEHKFICNITILFILIITIIINIAIHLIGEETIAGFLQYNPILGPIVAGFIGLIPNCAASVILTQLYLQNVISAATMISGLLVGAGVGLAVLFKANKNMKSNLKIIALLYSIGVISGIIIQLIGRTF